MRLFDLRGKLAGVCPLLTQPTKKAGRSLKPLPDAPEFLASSQIPGVQLESAVKVSTIPGLVADICASFYISIDE